MITEINHKIMPGGKRYSELIGLKDDILALDSTNIANGSKFTVINYRFGDYEAATFLYDEENDEWMYGDETAEDCFG